MITMIARMRVPPENTAAYEELMEYVTQQTRANEPGVLYYGWARSAAEPGLYSVIEVYADETVQAAHMASDWVRNSLPRAAELVEGSFEIEQYVSPGQEPITLQHG